MNPGIDLPEPVIEGVCEELGRQWSAVLSDLLQAEVQLRLRLRSYGRLGAFLLGCSEPTCLAHLEDTADAFAGLMEIPLATLFPLLTRMLGAAAGEPADQRRPLTVLEQRLAMRILRSLLGQAAREEGGRAGRLDVSRVENRSADWRSLPVQQSLLIASYELAWAGLNGTLRVGIVPEHFPSLAARADRTLEDGKGAVPAEAAGESEVRVVLARSLVPADDWQPLQVGDLLETELSGEALLEVLVEGKLAYRGRPGQAGGHKAVRIERPAEE